ncbi:hypothetical protein R1flu_011140 [Riccia fluitans]|uniref:Uncharacterized protein n=1 Tax=Riccia fluitans TaxID=41844 RepID=A0ABD1Z752_9MARC
MKGWNSGKEVNRKAKKKLARDVAKNGTGIGKRSHQERKSKVPWQDKLPKKVVSNGEGFARKENDEVSARNGNLKSDFVLADDRDRLKRFGESQGWQGEGICLCEKNLV